MPALSSLLAKIVSRGFTGAVAEHAHGPANNECADRTCRFRRVPEGRPGGAAAMDPSALSVECYELTWRCPDLAISEQGKRSVFQSFGQQAAT